MCGIAPSGHKSCAERPWKPRVKNLVHSRGAVKSDRNALRQSPDRSGGAGCTAVCPSVRIDSPAGWSHTFPHRATARTRTSRAASRVRGSLRREQFRQPARQSPRSRTMLRRGPQRGVVDRAEMPNPIKTGKSPERLEPSPPHTPSLPRRTCIPRSTWTHRARAMPLRSDRRRRLMGDDPLAPEVGDDDVARTRRVARRRGASPVR